VSEEISRAREQKAIRRNVKEHIFVCLEHWVEKNKRALKFRRSFFALKAFLRLLKGRAH